MEFQIGVTLLNILYAVCGAVIVIFFMGIGYLIFDKMTPFDTHKQLESGNIAVGIVIGSIFISLGIATGLVIGLGLN